MDRETQLEYAVRLLGYFSSSQAEQGKFAVQAGDLQYLVDLLTEVADIYRESAEQIACLPELPEVQP